MTKIAIIGDSHFDERSRFEECVQVHKWIAADAGKRGCTAWLHSGDVYHRKSTPLERRAVVEWVELMQGHVGNGVIVRGNHDAPVDLWPLGRLETNDYQHTVQVVESAQVVRLNHLGPEVIQVQCVPWPNRASLLGDSREQSEQDIAAALRDVLRGLSRSRSGSPRIVLAHAMVRGSRTSPGQPLVGCDCEIGLEDLALCESDFYALGHIHCGQDWNIDGAPVSYTGSPYRTAFGEIEPKGYLVVEFDGPRLVGWERIETPCTPMLLIDTEYHTVTENCTEPGLFCATPWTELLGAEVRLRYSVPQEHRAAARVAALEKRDNLLADGAVSVKLEEVVSVDVRSRVPDIANSTAVEDQLRAYWDSQNGSGPDAASRARMVEKLVQLQGVAS